LTRPAPLLADTAPTVTHCQVPQQGNGWLGAALFGALNLIGGHANPLPFVGLCRVAAVVPSTGLLRPHRPVDLKLRLFD